MIGDLLSGPVMDFLGKLLAIRPRKGSKAAFGYYVGTRADVSYPVKLLLYDGTHRGSSVACDLS